jgi:lipopolysaccharide biosynthesis glycosyltransferase
MCYGKYINSGVLLMNLDNLRKEDFVSKSLVLIKEKMNCE